MGQSLRLSVPVAGTFLHVSCTYECRVSKLCRNMCRRAVVSVGDRFGRRVSGCRCIRLRGACVFDKERRNERLQSLGTVAVGRRRKEEAGSRRGLGGYWVGRTVAREVFLLGGWREPDAAADAEVRVVCVRAGLHGGGKDKSTGLASITGTSSGVLGGAGRLSCGKGASACRKSGFDSSGSKLSRYSAVPG